MFQYQKQLTDHTLTSAELLAWRCPGVAARAEAAALTEKLLATIAKDRGPRAVYARRYFAEQLARLSEITARNQPLEDARDLARVAYAAALEELAETDRVLADATTETDQDCADLGRKKAVRVVTKACGDLVAALQAQLPPQPGATGSDYATSITAVREQTRQLAALAPKLANYHFEDHPIPAIGMAQAQGRSGMALHLLAIAEHDYLGDPFCEQLFNLRWVTACRAQGVPCDASTLDLPRAKSSDDASGWLLNRTKERQCLKI